MKKEKGLVAASPFPKTNSKYNDTTPETIGKEQEKAQEVYPQAVQDEGCPVNSKKEEREQLPEPHQKTKLMDLAMAENDFFRDRNEVAYARRGDGSGKKLVRIQSKDFKRWLANRYRSTQGKIASMTALGEVISAVEWDCLENSPLVEVYRRIGQLGDIIYFDLGGERFAEITPDGWSIVSSCPLHFIQPKGMGVLPAPESPGDVSLLRRVFAIDDEKTWTLVIGWALGVLNPSGPVPALILEGEQGSGKSVLCRVLKAILDPEESDTRAMPRTEQELFILSQNRLVLSFDNLSGLPQHAQDWLCRLVTGACFSARELYSNTEEVNLTARNPLLLNGIDDVATRPDLAERSIVLHLPSIPAERRRMEAEIWRDLYECRPQILAGLFTAASEALNRRGTTKLKKPPRMADFAHFVSSGELALKIPEGGFLRAYDEAQEAMNAVGLEGYPAMELLINVLKHENFEHRFAGTASALLDCLTKSAGENYALFKHPLWPKSAQILSNQIKRAAPLLRKRGVHYNQSRTGGERTWTIWMDEEKAREMPSPASSPSLCYQTNDDNDARDDVTQGWPYK